MPAIDMLKKRFHKVRVIEKAGVHPTRKGTMWKCLCDCGRIVEIEGRLLRNDTTKSCGCLVGKSNKTHGDSHSPTYSSWRAMLARCYNKKHRAYKNYGGRGITVCPEWRSDYQKFLADMGHRPAGLTLERRKNSLGYSRMNCYWATHVQQANNKRTNHMISFKGETKSLAAWSRFLKIPRDTLSRRIKNWNVTRAFTTPYTPNRKSKQ